MTKHFRNIRQVKLSNGNSGNYIKYAIGEIVLVVIGILFALQINNWNEERKLRKTIDNVYTIIQTDLLMDIENIDSVLAQMSPRDSIFRKVITQKMTFEDYENCANCSFILYGFPDITLNNRGLKLLDLNSTILDSHQDSLSIHIINFYSFYTTEINVAMEEITLDYQDNYSYFKNGKDWFVDYINREQNDKFIEYAITSSDYRNRVNSFHTLYFKIYLDLLTNYKKNALEIIEMIDEER